MWGKGKKRFGGGGGSEPAAKRQAAGDEGPSESAEDGTVVAEISKNKKVSVRSWKGKVYVDMREFYTKDGKTLPTKKGTTSAFFAPSLLICYSCGLYFLPAPGI
ncbi:hypothetical protein SEVIR_1G196000v4 [Setaria viridis]